MNQKIIFPLLVLTVILSFGISQVFADSYNIQAKSHGNYISLSFSDGTVTGIITLDNTIYLNNIPVIEKNDKLYIFDNQNNVKILVKQVGADKHLIILKSDDIRYRFLAVSDRIEDTVQIIKDNYQEKLKNDIAQLSINAQSYANSELTSESILTDWGKSKEITGTGLITNDKEAEIILHIIESEPITIKTFFSVPFHVEWRDELKWDILVTDDSKINTHSDYGWIGNVQPDSIVTGTIHDIHL